MGEEENWRREIGAMGARRDEEANGSCATALATLGAPIDILAKDANMAVALFAAMVCVQCHCRCQEAIVEEKVDQ